MNFREIKNWKKEKNYKNYRKKIKINNTVKVYKWFLIEKNMDNITHTVIFMLTENLIFKELGFLKGEKDE